MPPTPPYEIPAEYTEHFAAVNATVAEINAASNFGEYALLQIDEGSMQASEAKYHSDWDHNSWNATMYPYKSGIYRITTIGFSSIEYDLLGIRINDNIIDAKETLLNSGFDFTRTHDTPDYYREVFTMYGECGIKIVLTCESGFLDVKRMSISIIDPSDPFRDAQP